MPGISGKLFGPQIGGVIVAIVTFIFGLGGIISFLAQRYLTESLGY